MHWIGSQHRSETLYEAIIGQWCGVLTGSPSGNDQDWMSSLAGLVESHNQQGTGQNADWGNLSQLVGHFNAAQANGGGAQEFHNKCADINICSDAALC